MNIDSLFNFKVIGDREVACRFDTTSEPPNPLGLYVLDEQGEPAPEPDTVKWGQWFEEATKTGGMRLAEDTAGPYWVSTVFIGLDHGFGRGPPVLWETIIFGMEEEEIQFLGKRDRYRKTVDMFRYTSKAEALAGHARAVTLAESLPHSLPAEPEGNGELSANKRPSSRSREWAP
jgi:hypothetical protein